MEFTFIMTLALMIVWSEIRAGIHAEKIKEGEQINHFWWAVPNIGFAVLFSLAQLLFTSHFYFVGVSLWSALWVQYISFDILLNVKRGKHWSYLNPDSGSKLDKITGFAGVLPHLAIKFFGILLGISFFFIENPWMPHIF